MNTWSVGSFELTRGADRVTVQIDPSMDKNTIRAASIDIAQRFLGDSNGNGNGHAHSGKRRGTKRASAGTAVQSGQARTAEWSFTDDQRSRITEAIKSKNPNLTPNERFVLNARFLSGDKSMTNDKIAKELGLK